MAKRLWGRRRRKCFQRPIHIYIINIAQAHGIRKWPNYYFGSGLMMYMVLVFLIVKNDNTTQVLAWTGFANYPLFTYTLPCQGAVGETWLSYWQAQTPRVQAHCYVLLWVIAGPSSGLDQIKFGGVSGALYWLKSSPKFVTSRRFSRLI